MLDRLLSLVGPEMENELDELEEDDLDDEDEEDDDCSVALVEPVTLVD